MGTAALLLASGAAWATHWDWDVDVASRHWRQASLEWAQDVHPQHPSLQWIQNNVGPPTEELWCHYPGDPPTAEDCDIFYDRLDIWLQDYLGTSNVPLTALETFPKECMSFCRP